MNIFTAVPPSAVDDSNTDPILTVHTHMHVFRQYVQLHYVAALKKKYETIVLINGYLAIDNYLQTPFKKLCQITFRFDSGIFCLIY